MSKRSEDKARLEHDLQQLEAQQERDEQRLTQVSTQRGQSKGLLLSVRKGACFPS